MIYSLFSDVLTRAPGLVVGNPNYVKKVVFPLEILPSVALGSALFHIISLMVWLLAYFVFYGLPHMTVLFFPILLVPLSMFVVGASWILASLGVFLRDVSQVIGIAMTALMFMSPVFYPASALPENVRFLLYLNPLTPAIEQARDVLFWGKMPDFEVIAICSVVALVVAWFGFFCFQKSRRGFADVL